MKNKIFNVTSLFYKAQTRARRKEQCEKMESYFMFKNLAIILVAAKACGILARKLKAPQVVGEIIAGLLIGPSILGWVEQSDFLVQRLKAAVGGDGEVESTQFTARIAGGQLEVALTAQCLEEIGEEQPGERAAAP